MADTKAIKKVIEPVDPWTTDQADWQYVTIPIENNLGFPHDALSENHHKFEPGKTYFIPKLVAESVNERLRVYAKQCIKLIQPQRAADTRALSRQLNIALQEDPSSIR